MKKDQLIDIQSVGLFSCLGYIGLEYMQDNFMTYSTV